MDKPGQMPWPPGAKKTQIARAFGRHAPHYERHALLQQAAMGPFETALQRIAPALPKGMALEVGAGTGLASQLALAHLKKRKLLFTDLSWSALEVHRENLAKKDLNPEFCQWQVLDAEKLALNHRFAFVFSTFCLQWVHNAIDATLRMYRSLVAGGKLLTLFPAHGSYPEWQRLCEKLDLPMTANPLPQAEPLVQALKAEGAQCQVKIWPIIMDYKDPIDFFRSIKQIGAETSFSGKRMSMAEFNRLLRTWRSQGECKVTHQIAMIEATKPTLCQGSCQ